MIILPICFKLIQKSNPCHLLKVAHINHNPNILRPNTLKYCTCSKNKDSNSRGLHKEAEKALNQQIVSEFSAGYTYLSMACYFGRTEVALPGCQGFFYKMYEEELGHALLLINYQNVRGGRVFLDTVKVAAKDQDWKGIKTALKKALDIETSVKDQLTALTEIAVKYQDTTLCEFITEKLLMEQDASVYEIKRLLTRANKMLDSGVGEYLFDKEMYAAFVQKDGINKNSGVPSVYK